MSTLLEQEALVDEYPAANDEETVSTCPLTVCVPNRMLPRAFVAIVAILFLSGTLARGVYLWVPESCSGVREIAQRFDLDYENNIPAWVSANALLTAGVLLALIAVGKFRQRSCFCWHWAILALTFVYLSVDEAAYLHEILIVPLRRRLNAGGLLYFSWVIPGTIAVTIFTLAFLRFLWNLERVVRRRFILAGAVFVGGALGMECVGGAMADWYGLSSVRYSLAMMTEELMEIAGIFIFIQALVVYLRRDYARITFALSR